MIIVPIDYYFHNYKNSYIRMVIAPSNAISILSERGELIREIHDGYELELVLKELREGVC